MEWTTDLPQKEGYYWAILKRTKNIILVEYFGHQFMHGDIQEFREYDFEMFAGPLQPPKLPKGVEI